MHHPRSGIGVGIRSEGAPLGHFEHIGEMPKRDIFFCARNDGWWLEHKRCVSRYIKRVLGELVLLGFVWGLYGVPKDGQHGHLNQMEKNKKIKRNRLSVISQPLMYRMG